MAKFQKLSSGCFVLEISHMAAIGKEFLSYRAVHQ